jgi:hypothetical protein
VSRGEEGGLAATLLGRDGWHQLDAEPDLADAEVLQSLMAVGSSQERLEFLA